MEDKVSRNKDVYLIKFVAATATLIDYVERVIILYIIYVIVAIGEYLFLLRSYSTLIFIYGIVFFSIFYIVIFVIVFMTLYSKRGFYDQLKLVENVQLVKYFKVVVGLNAILMFLVLVSTRSFGSPILRNALLIYVLLGILFVIVLLVLRERLFKLMASYYQKK